MSRAEEKAENLLNKPGLTFPNKKAPTFLKKKVTTFPNKKATDV